MEPEITTKICDSTSIVVVIIHTKFQLHWMFKTEVRWVGHFWPPPLPPFFFVSLSLSMNRVLTTPSLTVLRISRKILSAFDVRKIYLPCVFCWIIIHKIILKLVYGRSLFEHVITRDFLLSQTFSSFWMKLFMVYI